MADLSIEDVVPSKQEIKSITLSVEKKDQIAAKFQKAKSKFIRFSQGISQALDRTVREVPHVLFDVDLREFKQLEGNLSSLNADTSQKLGVKTEEQKEAVDSLPPIERTARVLQKLEEKSKTELLRGRLPIEGILGDSDKIEGQTIDLTRVGRPPIDAGRWIQDIPKSPRAKKSLGKTVATFKLTSQMVERVKNEVLPTVSAEKLNTGTYGFESANDDIREMGDSWVVDVDESTRLYISKGGQTIGEHRVYDYTKPIKNSKGKKIGFEYETIHDYVEPIRTLQGAVKVEIDGMAEVSEVAKKLDGAFQNLGIDEALVVPDKQAEHKYKEARYRWQHRLEGEREWQTHNGEFVNNHGFRPVENLKRQEVFPGYSTVVDGGAAERYQRRGKIFLTHRVYGYNLDHLVGILKDGLLSSHDRYKRGLFTNGMSTERDFQTGGADNVFIRAIPETAKDNLEFEHVNLVLNPQILDRTDWWAYETDRYGSTDPDDFNSRPSPEQFFSNQRHSFHQSNEIMIRRGIGPEMIKGIVVAHEYKKKEIIERLQRAGISEVNGLPLAQFIGVHKDFGEFKRANGIATVSPVAENPADGASELLASSKTFEEYLKKFSDEKKSKVKVK